MVRWLLSYKGRMMFELVNDDIKVFVGFDQVEAVAFHTLSHSILTQSTNPVSIHPILSRQLRPPFTRERNPLQSNDFSFTRFLVPWLCGYKGWAIFMDCDMLLRDDISKLWNLRSSRYAVQVVKHDYTPKDDVKYLGNTQTPYPKKNWSSVMCNSGFRSTV